VDLAILVSLLPVHVASGDNANHCAAQGEDEVETAVGLGEAEGPPAAFGRGMFGIDMDDQRFPKEDLFTLPGLNPMPGENLRSVPGVPVEPGDPGEQLGDILHGVGHGSSIYRVYTFVKKQWSENEIASSAPRGASSQ
jgi:hypothetical protein